MRTNSSLADAHGGDVPSDEDLMVRVQEGHELSLRLLMDRHARSVFGFIRWMIGDRDWAENLAQDVFAAVYLRAATFKVGRRFAPWLYAMARHAAVDFARHRRFEIAARSKAGAPPLRSPDALETRELKEFARKALEELPEKFRAPIILCELEGMSYDQAAMALGCTAKTLSSRLTRGRDKLRRALERYLE